MAGVLPAEEINRRVAILKRFREMLRAQRDRFQEYLNVLDKQQDIIEKGDTEALLSHVELEEHIVTDIFNIQKVIDPLEDMYRTVTAQPGTNTEGETEVSGLKAAVERLKREATVNTTRNKDLLAKRMTEIRTEIKSLRGNPYAARQSIYADTAAPMMIDVKG
ncbi:flagellar export chaperone FlgN [Treponema primitia]|uniref:flagellar export chaperone FlgN n=1 Tax=Treponema primitia TaxID=88058 RepID=UPI0002554C9A|nr:flagellar export chaperone FlgN [Treponema primitia]